MKTIYNHNGPDKIVSITERKSCKNDLCDGSGWVKARSQNLQADIERCWHCNKLGKKEEHNEG